MIASDTRLTYTLTGDYRDFKAMLGVPDSSPDANLGAKVIIEADDKIVYNETILRKDKPKPISIDIKGVKKLKITVDSELPVNGNRVVLADARVQK